MQGNEQTDTARSAGLRQRAEALIAAKDPAGPTTSPEDVLALVQELHTHRIELELQNEDLRQAQSDLEQSRQRFSDLYDFAPVGHLTLSDKGMILEANLKIAEMLAVERRNLLQYPFSAFIIPDDQDIFYRYRAKLLAAKSRQTCELRLRGKDQVAFDVQLEGMMRSEMDGDAGQVRVCLIDISERKRLEEQLLQARKMEAVGTLAGGVAHEFNNILTAIIGFTEMARETLGNGGKAADDLDVVLQSAGRASDLVAQLLAFSRKGTHGEATLQPHLIVKEALKKVRASLPATVDLQEDIDTAGGFIRADPGLIHQVLINLCTNGLHALHGETGTLKVALGPRELSAEDVRGRDGLAPGSFLHLSVRDSGCGMDERTRQRIFDPFFTTRQTGRGTGLGLAVVHGIVRDCGGFITVESEVGEGTTFHAFFPAVKGEAEKNRQSRRRTVAHRDRADSGG